MNNIIVAIKESDSQLYFILGLPGIGLIKNKAAICIKTDNEDNPLGDDDVDARVSFFELNKNVLENLQAIAGEVFLPVLKNPRNQTSWSELVSKDLMDKFNVFLAQIQVTNGQIKGKTNLPLPPKDITTDTVKSNKDKAHILEASINTWTRQIKNVLKLDPESALKAGKDPGPLTELKFWEAKRDNLNQIYTQLQSDEIK